MRRNIALQEPAVSVDSAERDAMQVLQQTWRDLDAPDAFPVDPVKVARGLGVAVFPADLGGRVSGTLRNEPGADPEMHVNGTDILNRKRFTCAHLVGHYVRRVDLGETRFSFRDRWDVLSAEGADPDEVYANRFAAALLMPERLVRASFEATPSAAVLAARFGVSAQAMIWRLKNLGLIR